MKVKTKQLKELNRHENIFDGLDVSEETRREYTARIGLFLSHVQAVGFNQKSYLSYKRFLERRSDYAVATKNKYLITARVFLRELVRRGMLPIDVTANIKLFRQNKRHRRQGLTDTEVKLLGVKIQALPKTARNSRLQAMFSLLAYQGLRQIEIVRLDVEDIDLEKETALILGKGEDDKELIYLTPVTVKAVRDYIRLHNPKGALFSSMGNRKRDRLSTRTIKREFQSLFTQLGYEKTVHGFRHFYITELLKNMDMRDVRKFSRHRSMEMLIVYDDEVSLKEKTAKVFQVMRQFDLSH
ncbi:MAG: tyrosine-type recombinase/integrase [Candidatus Jorgensenbacteria bacterium]|nr:tyrosine-type recombinase/integrase [Candidatus Jorgensenbacteria bacterium]